MMMMMMMMISIDYNLQLDSRADWRIRAIKIFNIGKIRNAIVMI